MKQKVTTADAPSAIGSYSQGIQTGNTIYLSGQIPLDPITMQLVSDDFREQAVRVFKNMEAVCKASGGSLEQIVKLTVYLTDLNHFPIFNEVMSSLFMEPYPARTTIEVTALPKAAQVEVEAIMVV